MPFSIYIHVPFCLSRCAYCAFYSGEPLQALEQYPQLVCSEIELRARDGDIPGPVATLYFGGGTPSLLRPDQVGRIVESVAANWGLDAHAEVSLEVNPCASADLAGFRAAGITRLSVGVQCFDDARLADLGRSHRAAEARAVLRQASRIGFPNVGADLLYGLPDLEVGELRTWVRELADLEVVHISAYCLEVHSGTPLASSVSCGQFRPAVSCEEVAQWEALVSAMEAAKYRIYEISNFARAGFRCRHNLAYWCGHPYLGIGPGAHGFAPDAGDWGTRAWNDTGLASYGSRLQRGLLPSGGVERLNRQQALLERLFLGLRRPQPIDSERFCRDLLVNRWAFARVFERLREHGFVAEGPGGVYTPRLEGMRRADGLAVWAHSQIEQPLAGAPA